MNSTLYELHELISEKGVFTDGDWIESKDQDQNGDVRLIQLADVGVGEFINKSNRFMTSEKAREIRCTFLEPGDILVARMPDPIGRACIFPGLSMPCVTVVDVCIVRPASKYVDPKWLMHMLNSKKFNNKILQYVTGTTRQRISRGNLAKLEVHLPPLAEQKRIAAILDKADTIRRKRQQAIQLADDFLRAVFLDMFGDPVTNPKGWNEKKWQDVLVIINGKNQRKVESLNGKYPIYGSGGKMGLSDDYLCNENTVIIGRKGNINKPILVKEKFWNVDTAFGLSAKTDKLSFYYLYWFCLFFDFEKLNKTVTIPSLTKSDLLEINLPLPPLQEQNKFAEICEKVSGLLAKSINSLDLSHNNVSSISQKAFSGQF